MGQKSPPHEFTVRSKWRAVERLCPVGLNPTGLTDIWRSFKGKQFKTNKNLSKQTTHLEQGWAILMVVGPKKNLNSSWRAAVSRRSAYPHPYTHVVRAGSSLLGGLSNTFYRLLDSREKKIINCGPTKGGSRAGRQLPIPDLECLSHTTQTDDDWHKCVVSVWRMKNSECLNQHPARRKIKMRELIVDNHNNWKQYKSVCRAPSIL